MHNKQQGFIIPLVIIAAVVIVGGGVYYVKTHTNTEVKTESTAQGDAMKSDTNSAEQTVDANGNVMIKGSFAELAKSGKDYECTFTATHESIKTEGHVFVSGENVHGEFKTSIPNYGPMTAHMIADANFVYTWSSVMPQGIKVSKTKDMNANVQTGGQVNTSTGSIKTNGSQNFDYNGMYDYNCKPWSKDASVFVPPSNVTFRVL